MHRPRLVALCLTLLVATCATSREPAPPWGNAPDPQRTGELRDAVGLALPLLQASMDTWIREQSCSSCHHQALGVLAVVMAEERDLAFDEESHERQVERLVSTLPDRLTFELPDGSLHGEGGSFGRSYQLLALAAVGEQADERTDAAAHELAGNAVARGPRDDQRAWLAHSDQPPLQASPVSSTALAAHALGLYGPPAREAEFRATRLGARRWLEAYEPRNGEERAMRLLGLRWTGAPPETLRAAAQGILAKQRKDGGWAQLPTRKSDAYATGQALVALQQAGGLATEDRTFQRGLNFLLETQLADGSWLVRTRRRSPGLPQFETGFPHGTHQFVSTAATAWAVMALCCGLDPAPTAAVLAERPARREPRAPEALPRNDEFGLTELQHAAAFGTAQELARLLAAGADPDDPGEVGPEGLTPLHLAVRDPYLVELLLAHGAEVDSRAVSGATPLVLACGYGPGDAAARMLLARGADPLVRADGDGSTPFLRAARRGKLDLLKTLAAAGADPDQGDAGGRTALYGSVAGGDLETSRRLLELGAGVDLRCEGATPLHRASRDGKPTLVRLLLLHGAELEAVDDEGMTPLAWAAKIDHGDVRTLHVLLEAGADPLRPRADGRTPLDWARKYDHALAIDALERELAAREAAEAK